MSTLIVGCGYLGLRVGEILVKRHETVFGTTRKAARAETLKAFGIVPIIADVLVPSPLSSLPPIDRVLFCVGLDRSAGIPVRTIYVDGLNRVVQALEGRINSIVYVSSTGVYGKNDGSWVDEETPADPLTESGKACLEAESLLAGRTDLETRVIRFSGLYGPGRFIRRASLARGEPIPGDPSRFLNLIHIQDAAEAAVAVLDRGSAGSLYLASDDRPITRETYFRLAANLLNAPEPVFTGTTGAFPEKSNKRVSNRKIKEELGLLLMYPDITTGLPAALAEDGGPVHSPGAGSM